MTMSDLRVRIADQLKIIGWLIAAVLLAACNQPRVAQAPANSSPSGIDVVELSATDAQARMTAGSLTSADLTRAYLDRIAKIDDAGPTLDAVIELNQSAAADAAALDAERKAGTVRGPL